MSEEGRAESLSFAGCRSPSGDIFLSALLPIGDKKKGEGGTASLSLILCDSTARSLTVMEQAEPSHPVEGAT